VRTVDVRVGVKFFLLIFSSEIDAKLRKIADYSEILNPIGFAQANKARGCTIPGLFAQTLRTNQYRTNHQMVCRH
jgi:hypothetical protein